VHEVFGELGAAPELARCRDMFRELDSRPPNRGDATRAAPQLTPREWEVAQLVSRRLSNKGIARKLGIKERTVTTHLSNVYRKLSIGSRGELVDRVREGRLRAASDDD
jgi:DNA-binding NarL/FixJ family response regulator